MKDLEKEILISELSKDVKEEKKKVNIVVCYFCKNSGGTYLAERHPESNKKMKDKNGRTLYYHLACKQQHVVEVASMVDENEINLDTY